MIVCESVVLNRPGVSTLYGYRSDYQRQSTRWCYSQCSWYHVGVTCHGDIVVGIV